MDEDDTSLKFKNSRAAVAWADELLSRPGVKSIFGSIIGKPKSGVYLGDLLDLAHTISVVVTSVKPKCAGLLYRYTYGEILTEDAIDMADWVYRTLRVKEEYLPFAVSHGTEKLRLLVQAMIAEVSFSDKTGKPWSRVKVIEYSGISKSRFFADWIPLVSDIENHIKSILDMAEKQIDLQFSEKGIFE